MDTALAVLKRLCLGDYLKVSVEEFFVVVGGDLETGSGYVAQTPGGPQPFECWNYRCISPRPANIEEFRIKGKLKHHGSLSEHTTGLGNSRSLRLSFSPNAKGTLSCP